MQRDPPAAGELDLDTSAAIKRETKQAVDAGRNQYTETMGISELRKELAAKVSAKTGVAPAQVIAAVEATNEFGGVMTS